MIRNKLKIIDSKTEFLVLHSSFEDCNTDLGFKIGEYSVQPSKTCWNLGVILDAHMKMENQFHSVRMSVNFHLRRIHSVHNSLTDKTTVLLVHALIASRLAYCNFLLHGLPDKLINCLQHLQNVPARIAKRCSNFNQITPVLYELHWLPMLMRIRFKQLVMYRCVQQTAPVCTSVSSFNLRKTSVYSIRSYALDRFHVSDSASKSYGDRAFCVSDPTELNKLLLEIRQAKSVEIFKTKLKALLFNEHFVWRV